MNPTSASSEDGRAGLWRDVGLLIARVGFYLAAFLFLFMTGPGRFSLDQRMKNW